MNTNDWKIQKIEEGIKEHKSEIIRLQSLIDNNKCIRSSPEEVAEIVTTYKANLAKLENWLEALKI